MKRDFLTHLPSEIITNILSRLPLQTISISKCVCKPWLHLLEADDFVRSHLSTSAPTLAVLTTERDSSPSFCTLFQFTDDHQKNLITHELHYTALTNFALPHVAEITGSANGLLLLSTAREAHHLCNPITREYAEVPFPKELIRPYPKVFNYPEILGDSVYSYPESVCYGFGTSRVSGEYKVVRVYQSSVIVDGGRRAIPEPECHVHTLGTGEWRRVGPGEALFELPGRTSSYVFLNGNIHWVMTDAESMLWICCFDLETERFSSFSTPPVYQGSFELIPGMSALKGCLCLCDHTGEDETVIWLMKEYGVENSWTKEYVIKLNEDDLDIQGFELVYAIKVFEDGDILLLREDMQLFCYSGRSGTAREIAIFGEGFVNAIVLNPSFVSLKGLGMESVVLL